MFPTIADSVRKEHQLRSIVLKDVKCQTHDDYNENPFDTFSDFLMNACERSIKDVETDVENDKIFIDELEKRQSLFKNIRQSLRISKDMGDFMDKFNDNFLYLVQKQCEEILG